MLVDRSCTAQYISPSCTERPHLTVLWGHSVKETLPNKSSFANLKETINQILQMEMVLRTQFGCGALLEVITVGLTGAAIN